MSFGAYYDNLFKENDKSKLQLSDEEWENKKDELIKIAEEKFAKRK